MIRSAPHTWQASQDTLAPAERQPDGPAGPDHTVQPEPLDVAGIMAPMIPMIRPEPLGLSDHDQADQLDTARIGPRDNLRPV